jgi:hypothetical protein
LLPQYDNEYAVVIQAEAVIKNAVNNQWGQKGFFI